MRRAALAARDGRLAVASRATGKVHFFDARDPKRRSKPQGTLGTGDGPFGPYRPDRFLFPARRNANEPGCDVNLALGPEGCSAVTEDNRLLVFDRQGKSLWTTFGLSGDACVVSFADPGRVFTLDGRKSLRLDEGSGTWSPDALWYAPRGDFLGAFADGDKTFGVFVIATVHQNHGPLLGGALRRLYGASRALAGPGPVHATVPVPGRQDIEPRRPDPRPRRRDRDGSGGAGFPSPLRGGPVAPTGSIAPSSPAAT